MCCECEYACVCAQATGLCLSVCVSQCCVLLLCRRANNTQERDRDVTVMAP